MVPQRTPPLPSDVMEKLGALTEASDRADEDRRDLKRTLEGLSTSFHGMELAFNAMSQTLASTSTSVASLAAQKTDVRVAELERRVAHYDRLIGTAGKFAVRVITGLLSAAVAGGVGAKILTAMHIL